MKEQQYKRTVYLEDKPRQEAVQELIEAFAAKKRTELIRTEESLGRVTAEPIFANASMPHYHASAMDGIAVVAERTFSAHEKHPVRLKLNEDFMYIDTGNAVLFPFNAVIMIENVEEIDEETVEIIEPAVPWQHIRPIGEDIVQEEMLFSQGHTIRPVDIGALLAARVLCLPLMSKPVVSIIPTGNELVHASADAETGHLIEFNGTVFANYITEWGGKADLKSIVPDEPNLLKEAILRATEDSDIVVINAGSSAGSKDYTVHILAEMGEVLTHGVATRPGKPVILAKVNDTVVVGIPGYPVSAYLALDWFIRPLICEYLGTELPEREKIMVTLGRRVVSSMGAESFIRVNIGFLEGKYVAVPIGGSAGVTMSLVKADGLLIVPADILGFEQGEIVEVELLKPLSTIKGAYIFNGSHDLTIDYLSSFLKRKSVHSKIVSTHTGSMAGMLAIKKGEAHVAGVHLLDAETNVYNKTYIEKIMRGIEVVLVPFLKRKQGWMIQKGNPLEIQSLKDIAEKKAIYANRQKGAGTRILFDYLLRQENIPSTAITGYNREFFSHLSVAAEVKMNKQAVGLGVYSAAKAMDVDFIPLADESYDLLMRRSFFESRQGQELLSIMEDPEFIKEVEKMGGYEVVSKSEPVFFNNALC